jgi:predicted transcriptional regulator
VSPTRYETGRRFEQRCRDALRKAGFFVIRSAGSKTPIDLVAIAAGETYLVQCKKAPGLFTAKAMLELMTLRQCLHTPIILATMERPRGPLKWMVVGPGGPPGDTTLKGLAERANKRLKRSTE